MANVIIIGGHGRVALLAAPLLVASGHEVTSVIRNPEHSREVAATGAHPVVADIEQLDTDAIAELFDGQQQVIWSAGAGGGDPARTRAVDQDAAIRSMDAAAKAKIRRYIMVSYAGARPDHGVSPDSSFFHYAEAKSNADQYLRETELDWTILGPGTLTFDEPTGLVNARTGRGPLGSEQSGRGPEGSETTDPVPRGNVSRGNVARMISAMVDAKGPSSTTIAFIDGTTAIADVVSARI